MKSDTPIFGTTKYPILFLKNGVLDQRETEMRSYRKETLDSVYNKLVCRKSEIDLLLTLFGVRGSFVSPSIFICGHTATGKTVVVETLLKDLEVSMLFI